jgi:hypothetical protein
MIRATGTAKGRKFLLLGVDRENINRLTAGKPIIVRAESLDLERDVMIVFGETLQDVADQLEKAGFNLPPGKGKPQ